MELWHRWCWWVILALAQFHVSRCLGCWEQERIALLQIKASMDYPNGTSLPSWNSTDKESDCCAWESVQCNITTGRIIKLLLNFTRDFNSPADVWYLNASSFLPFEELIQLDLSGNNIAGCVANEGLGKLSRLSNLEVLDLTGNLLNNSILLSLNELSNLRTLALGQNYLMGSIYIEEFDGLENLKELDLSDNGLDSIITDQGLERDSRMKNVEVLDLSFNYFNNNIWSFLRRLSSLKTLFLIDNNLNGTVPTQDLENLSSMENLVMDGAILDINFLLSIRVLTSLQVLSLQNCGLTGSLPTQGLCELKTLRELDFHGNKLWGNLHWCLMNLTSLRLLDVSSNQFTGNIALPPLINLTSLEYLALSDNHFEIPVSFKSFFNHTKLKFIESLNNKLLEENFLASATSFQLIGIRLSDSEHGSPSKAFPHFLYHQHDLEKVELSRIDFGGKFPNWLLGNNTGMITLLLPNNSFRGPFQLPSHTAKELLALDISNNKLLGCIPYKIASSFPSLEFLNMSINSFEGDIPSSFGDITSLSYLDLSNNRLSGEIPMHMAMGCRLMRLLKLSNNILKGPMLPLQTNMTTLKYLFLDHNHFTEIPYSLSRSDLRVLNVSYNELSGRIPGWVGKMAFWVLAMANNHLEGPIPIEFCQLDQLTVLDLSENNITGTIPSCFNPPYIQQVLLSKNRLHGPFPKPFQNSSLRMLDLSHNHLNSNIPTWISSFFQLNILLLKNSSLKGNIPNQLCHLPYLALIDLSFNNLFGSIPPCITIIDPRKRLRLWILAIIPSLQFTSFLHDLKMVAKSKQNPYTDSMNLSLLVAQAEFTTKGTPYSYKGVVLQLFSGVDLSNNKLTGPIPLQIGDLNIIQVLNLSHNNLTGTIPATFSNLKNIESLDLSYNNLNGIIPFQLIELYSLEVFNVSYNNLTGRTPQRVSQFATFDSSSYAGNQFLCGEPLPRKCNESDLPPSTPRANNGSEVDYGFIDMDAFYMSFTGSYITVLLAIVGILYINPYWRRAWFHLVEVFITSCYYCVVDNLPRLKVGFFRK